MFIHNKYAWSFAAQIFFSRVWLWLFFGFLQAYLFALGTLLVSSISWRLLIGKLIPPFLLFAQHIHMTYVFEMMQQYGVVGSLLLLCLGLIFLSSAFWLHFCFSRIAHVYAKQCPFDVLRVTCVQFLLPTSWRQVRYVVTVSFVVTGCMLLGFLLGIVPGCILYLRLFAVFPLLADGASLTLYQLLLQSWSLTRSSWRSIVLFSIEAFLLYSSLMYLFSYVFLVVVFPLARYGWYVSLLNTSHQK